MKYKIALLLLSSLVLSACSDGGGSGKGGKPSGKVTREDLKRWPERGEYTVSFTYNGCTDEYSGSGKAQYCVDLTDESKSKCNTQSQRKRVYQEDCGDDFDERVARQFPPAPSTTQPAPTTTTTLPPSNGNEPWPTTTTTTQPRPESNFEKAQKAFADIGIELKVTEHGNPIDHLYPDDIENGAAQLLKLKNEFAARSASYKKITLNTYTSYDPGDLDLDPRLSFPVMQAYLSLNDQRISLHQSTGVFVDFSIDIYGRHDANKDLENFRSDLNFFTSRRNDLKSISAIFKTIKLYNYDSIQFYDQTLQLDEKTYQAHLPQLLKTLKPFADIGAGGTVFKGYISGDKSTVGMQQLSTWLSQNVKAMNDLQKYHQSQGDRFEIELRGDYDNEPMYSPTVGNLAFSIQSKFDPSGMNALLAIIPTVNAMNAKLDLPSFKLNADFTRSAKLLAQRSEKLKSLKGKIKEIYFSGSKTDFSYNTLWIGPNSSLAELDKVLNSIK